MTAKLNILIAYPYFDKSTLKVVKTMKDTRLLIDSGAFTAWKAGKQIKVEDYCAFIKNLPVKPFAYFMLDVIGDPKATLKNYEFMLKEGLKPIPIFTRGEAITALDEYYKTSEIVGIGGLVGTRKNAGFVKGIMSHVKSRKCHWLGFASLPFIAHFKPYMCDSSSWSSSVRYGSMSLFTKNFRQIRLTKKDFQKLPRREIFDVFKWYGEDIFKFKKQSEWAGPSSGHTLLQIMPAKSVVRRSLDIEKKFGTKFFIATSSSAADIYTKIIYEAFQFWKDKGEK